MIMSELPCTDFVINIQSISARYLLSAPVRQFRQTEQVTGATALTRKGGEMSGAIKNVKQYQELSQLLEMARENEGTMRFGAHFFLKEYLKSNFGVVTGDNRDTYKKAQRLLDEFLTAYIAEDE